MYLQSFFAVLETQTLLIIGLIALGVILLITIIAAAAASARRKKQREQECCFYKIDCAFKVLEATIRANNTLAEVREAYDEFMAKFTLVNGNWTAEQMPQINYIKSALASVEFTLNLFKS